MSHPAPLLQLADNFTSKHAISIDKFKQSVALNISPALNLEGVLIF